MSVEVKVGKRDLTPLIPLSCGERGKKKKEGS